ncbi:hypothetical protein CBL_03573 [Carabus blaptoides fortunei]
MSRQHSDVESPVFHRFICRRTKQPLGPLLPINYYTSLKLLAFTNVILHNTPYFQRYWPGIRASTCQLSMETTRICGVPRATEPSYPIPFTHFSSTGTTHTTPKHHPYHSCDHWLAVYLDICSTGQRQHVNVDSRATELYECKPVQVETWNVVAAYAIQSSADRHLMMELGRARRQGAKTNRRSIRGESNQAMKCDTAIHCSDSTRISTRISNNASEFSINLSAIVRKHKFYHRCAVWLKAVAEEWNDSGINPCHTAHNGGPIERTVAGLSSTVISQRPAIMNVIGPSRTSRTPVEMMTH